MCVFPHGVSEVNQFVTHLEVMLRLSRQPADGYLTVCLTEFPPFLNLCYGVYAWLGCVTKINLLMETCIIRPTGSLTDEQAGRHKD